MSIRRQLALGISLLMLLVMGGNLLLNIYQLRTNFEHQLTVRAEEIATTLALTLTHNAQTKDNASLRSMIDVVFDRGHYLEIRFDYVDGSESVMRTVSHQVANTAPKWFTNKLTLRGGYSEAFVTDGWSQLGLLKVQLHPGLVYQQMWELVKAEVAWYALMLFIVLYGLRLLLAWQLKPLKSVLDLAEKLAANQFLHITKEPKAKELKILVRAMNQLSDRLQASFTAHGETVRKLQQENFHDSLTELNNRKGWDRFLNDWMKPESFAPGWMMLIRIENLQELNATHGKSQIDEIIMQVAMLLKTEPSLNHEHVCTARLGGEFWVFSPETIDSGSAQRITLLAKTIRRLSHVQHYQVSLGIVGLPINDVIAPASIKHQLDILMERSHAGQHEVLIGETESLTLTNWVHWQKRLSEALKDEKIELYAQDVFDAKGQLIQKEVHCRLSQVDGDALLAGYFWPMVDRLDFSVAFDQLVIHKWLKLSDKKVDWVINLSSKSINDENFHYWFEKTLNDDTLNTLIIECSEYTLAYMSESARQWLHKMSAKGLRLSFDHVGTSGKSFGFLSRFPIYQGKIEKRFIRDVDQHSEHAFFVSSMIKVFHAQQALCLAEGIESEAEKNKLIELGVDAVMGYALGKPVAL